MNLFATWEIDRSAPSCVPRLCSLRLKKLTVLRELDKELSSVLIAVKIQGSKRVLRSNEYVLPPGGLMETDLELTFSLQYPHFLKRDGNKLQIMLQRRKRYKNRTILGYKTLAVGIINMAEVMQHPTDGGQLLGLHSNMKDVSIQVAEISIYSLSSQPIDHEDGSVPSGPKIKASDRSPDMDNYSEEDDDSFSSEQEASDDAVQGQDLYDEEDEVRKPKKARRKMIRTTSMSRQPNFKQKFVALLKRFKVMDEVLDSDPVGQTREVEEDLGLLYDSLEECNNSDSGPELEDNESVHSTPKPTLRRFFEGVSHSGSQTEIGSLHGQKGQERESSSPGQAEKRKAGAPRALEEVGVEVVAAALEPEEPSPRPGAAEAARRESSVDRLAQLGSAGKPEPPNAVSPSKAESRQVWRPRSTSMKDRQNLKGQSDRTSSLDSESSPDSRHSAQVPRKSVYDQLNQILISDEQLPESIILVNVTEWQGQYLSEQLQAHKQPVVSTWSVADVQAAFNTIVARIQRYQSGRGGRPELPECRVAALRGAAGQQDPRLAELPPLPRGATGLSPAGQVPGVRGWEVQRALPGHGMEGAVQPGRAPQRRHRGRPWPHGSVHCRSQPVSPAAHLRGHADIQTEEVVKVGLVEQCFSASVDSDDATVCTSSLLSSTPPAGAGTPHSKEAMGTPPPSPSVSSSLSGAGSLSPGMEVMGLQVDYWTTQGPEKKKEGEKREMGLKNTLKSNFRSLQVSRVPSPGELVPPTTMAMTVVTKEKNKKVMFLSKKPKEKDLEPKSQVIEGITRLICTAKHQNTMLRVSIDGVEWNDVKFFQLAAQWPTHVKHLPVGIFGYSKNV
ncbi:phosphofurin acidic cluster sorting protein 2-like isoform X5 [Natator depressus]|uniref:phosphofurin acidic cluster sorting protein 2-like isoform X5 n=1 Tax=Natator depressus TaxID=27790 RepID=UPI003EC08883